MTDGISLAGTTAGIVRGRWTSNERHYYLAALEFYDEVVFVNPRLVRYHFDRERRGVDVIYGTMRLNDLAMLYTFGRVDETLLLVRCLELCGVPVSDPFRAISRDSLAKLADTTDMIPAGAGTTTHVIVSPEMAAPTLDALDEGAFPLLNKPIAGNKGRGIVKLANRDEALAFCRNHFRSSGRFLVFEQLMDYSHEYRVYLVDGHIVDAYEKVREGGRGDIIVMNLHQGAKPQAIEPAIKEELFAWLAAVLPERYRTGIYGVDLATTADGEPHIIEINRTPGFSGLQRVGGIDLPRTVHRLLRQRARETRHYTPQTYRLTLLGDTNAGETYQLRLEEQGQANILKSRGYDCGFASFRPFLAESDYTVANLEACLTRERTSPHEGIKPYLDWSDPEQTPQLLRSLPIHAVSLANNHVLDFGPAGLEETCAVLDRHGIRHFGAGLTAESAARALRHRFTLAGQDIELIIASGFEFRQNHADWNYYATPGQAGVNPWPKAAAEEQIAALRTASPEAILIAFPHWGSNYLYVTDRQRELGRRLLDAGADLVVGHGSHMLQEIEQHDGRFIVYGLGNFVYNSPGRFHRYPDVLPFGLLARLFFSMSEDSLEIRARLYPIHTDNRANDYRPHFLDDSQFQTLLLRLMPDGGTRSGLEELIRCGRDRHGPYLALDIGRRILSSASHTAC
jgi:glutathione synthase/RimK-type ligase-like ATP-grasp enzyme